MGTRAFRFGASHRRTDDAALRLAVWCQRHPFGASAVVCSAALAISPAADLVLGVAPAGWERTLEAWVTAVLFSIVLGLGLVGMPALFQLVGGQARWLDRGAPALVLLVASAAFAAANWAVSGGDAESGLNAATMVVGCPATLCWAWGFALRWRIVRVLGRPWLVVAPCAGFALWGWFISWPLGLGCFFVLLVLVPLAVHGALAGPGRLAWLAWPLVAGGAAIAAKIVEGTYFPGPVPAAAGTLVALAAYAPLLSLARVANRISAVPADHPIVVDFGAAAPYARSAGS